jgi:predicted secreted acid phosphatase
MIVAISRRSRRIWLVTVVLLGAFGCAAPRLTQHAADPPASDLLNAVLWTQRSVEFKASALTAFALARIRLDQALAGPSRTGAPKEQAGVYQSLPAAVILDIDETILDNSGYQAWMALKGTAFDPKTWNAYARTARPRKSR